jgi:hypothetical protein
MSGLVRFNQTTPAIGDLCRLAPAIWADVRHQAVPRIVFSQNYIFTHTFGPFVI